MGEAPPRDLTLAPDRAGVLSVPISIARIGSVVGPHTLLHHENPLRQAFELVGGSGVAAAPGLGTLCGLDRSALVEDHPSRVGCEVVG